MLTEGTPCLDAAPGSMEMANALYSGACYPLMHLAHDHVEHLTAVLTGTQEEILVSEARYLWRAIRLVAASEAARTAALTSLYNNLERIVEAHEGRVDGHAWVVRQAIAPGYDEYRKRPPALIRDPASSESAALVAARWNALDRIETIDELNAWVDYLVQSGLLDRSGHSTAGVPGCGWLTLWTPPITAEIVARDGLRVTVRLRSGEIARWSVREQQWQLVEGGPP